MLSIFRALIDRLKAMFAVSAAQELESDLLLRDAERQAELLRRAGRYEAEGLHGIAGQIRQRAEGLSGHRPLAGVLPALQHLAGNHHDEEPTPLLSAVPTSNSSGSHPRALPAPGKKRSKK